MEIFYNSHSPGYEEIVSYGPKWWTEYKEMDAVYMFEGWLLDILAKKMEQEVKNLFPSQADDSTLFEYEKLFGIEHDVEISIEDRRRIVEAYYAGIGHLSRSSILQLIKTYTGHEGNVQWGEGGVLLITFNNDDSVFVSLGILQKIIERRIPAHIPFQTRCTCTVRLGIGTSIDVWNKRFILAGTVPDTNIGLGVGKETLALMANAEAFKMRFPESGNSGDCGLYPDTSSQLELVSEKLSFEVQTQALNTKYPISGNSGESGIFPKQSTKLQNAEENILSDISTKNWTISFPVCGDALGI